MNMYDSQRKPNQFDGKEKKPTRENWERKRNCETKKKKKMRTRKALCDNKKERKERTYLLHSRLVFHCRVAQRLKRERGVVQLKHSTNNRKVHSLCITFAVQTC
jgi:hypothetical protein